MKNSFSSQAATPIKSAGLRLYLNPEDQAVSETLAREGKWEPLETQVVTDEVTKGDVVLDLGANIGYYTLLLSRLVGDRGRVFAFEPDPTNFGLLEKNVALNACRNVTLIQKAVSNRTGSAQLYLAEADKGDHRIYTSVADHRHAIGIDVIRLDDYFTSYRGGIHFIKMDIQGAEGGAVEGMPRLLERNQNVKILTEFSPAGLKGFGTDPEEFLRLLIKHGFNLYHVDSTEDWVEQTTISKLLNEYVDDGGKYTTVFCTRNEWPQVHAYETWRDQLYRATREILDLIPAGHSVILVDAGKIGVDKLFSSGHCTPFLERDSKYWGAPPDDATAVLEFERLRQSGASFIVFAWPPFWWLDYYAELNRHLRSTFRCILENDRLVVFDLRS